MTLLVNGDAGRARKRAWLDPVSRVLERRFELTVVHPASAGQTVAAARAAADSAVPVLAVAGGDGTMNHAVQGLLGGSTMLAVLPAGTANDLARALGVPLDPLRAAEIAVSGCATRMDVIDVNGHPFCTMGGLGLVADAALAVAAVRDSPGPPRALVDWIGPLAYQAAGAWQILVHGGTTIPIRLSMAGATFEREVHGLFVLNQRTLGATMALPTGSAHADGVFEICLICRSSRVELLRSLRAIGRDVPPAEGAIEIFRGTAARIECPKPLRFLGDGDRLCEASRFDIAIRPGALSVLA